MIKILKGDAPKKLIAANKTLTEKNKEEFDKTPAEYLSGRCGFKITNDYKSESVKEALKARQYNKCCFSEAKFTGDYPHVEHFRPKARIDILETKEELYPGYYWLTYEWSNLFFCKPIINCSYKRNFFPLYNEVERNRTHHDTNIEKSKIINPSIEDPREFIRFKNDEPIGVDEEGRGYFNVIFLGLRDPSFEDDRRDKFNLLRTLKEQVDIGVANGLALIDPILAGNLTILKDAILPHSEFSSMAIDLLQGWPPLRSDLKLPQSL